MKYLKRLVFIGVLALLFAGFGSVAKSDAYPYILLPGVESPLHTVTYNGHTYQVLLDSSGNIIPVAPITFHMPGYTPWNYPSPKIDFSADFSNGSVDVNGDFTSNDGGDGPFAPFESYLLAVMIADMCAL